MTWRLFGKRELQNLAWPVQGLWSLGLNLGLTVQCSAQLPLLCYQETADNRGSCRGLQLPSYRVLEVNTSKKLLEPRKFRSQSSKRQETSCKRLENSFVTLFQFVVGFCLGDPTLKGLGFPRSQARGNRRLVPFGGLSQITKSLNTKAMSNGRFLGASSPYLDEMMMTNVKLFQILRFANDKRFQNFVQKLWTQVSIPWVTQKDVYGVWLVVSMLRCHCPMMIKRWSQRDLFLIKHPSI